MENIDEEGRNKKERKLIKKTEYIDIINEKKIMGKYIKKTKRIFKLLT